MTRRDLLALALLVVTAVLLGVAFADGDRVVDAYLAFGTATVAAGLFGLGLAWIEGEDGP